MHSSCGLGCAGWCHALCVLRAWVSSWERSITRCGIPYGGRAGWGTAESRRCWSTWGDWGYPRGVWSISRVINLILPSSSAALGELGVTGVLHWGLPASTITDFWILVFTITCPPSLSLLPSEYQHRCSLSCFFNAWLFSESKRGATKLHLPEII